MNRNPLRILLVIVFIIGNLSAFSQFRPKRVYWTEEGNSTLIIRDGSIIKTDIESGEPTIVVDRKQLIPAGATQPLQFNIYSFSSDYKHLLIFTNTAKVWRYHTRGDY